jgi:hypothetical protein
VRIAAAALAITLLAACGESTNTDATEGPIAPVAVSGFTDQGLRVRLEPVADDRARVRVSVDCEPGAGTRYRGAIPIPLEEHVFEAQVAGDGSFEVDDRYVVDGGDGDQDHVEAHIEGSYARDGTARGSVTTRDRLWNGQGHGFDGECPSSTLSWEATEPQPVRDDITLPVAGVTILEARGNDVVAVTETGDLVEIDGTRVEVARTFPLGVHADPTQLDIGFVDYTHTITMTNDAMWIADPNQSARAIVRADLNAGAMTARVEKFVSALVAAPDALWATTVEVGDPPGYTLEKLDLTTGEVLATAPTLDGRLALGPTGEVWRGRSSRLGAVEAIERIDTETLAVTTSFPVDLPDNSTAFDVRATDQHVWILGEEAVASISTATGVVNPVPHRSWTRDMATDGEGVWVSQPRESVIRRIEDGRVTRTVDVPADMDQITVTDDGVIWLASTRRGEVVRLDLD